jgi:hypothetical protein
MTLALVLGALLALGAVFFVSRAFLREPVAEVDALDEPGPLEQRWLELAEDRDRALAALKELEFDHRTGKVSDDDYRELVGPLRRAAAEALRALEPTARGGREAPAARPAREKRRQSMTEIPAPVPSPGPPEPAIVPEPMPVPDPGPPEPAIVPEPGPARIPEPGPR